MKKLVLLVSMVAIAALGVAQNNNQQGSAKKGQPRVEQVNKKQGKQFDPQQAKKRQQLNSKQAQQRQQMHRHHGKPQQCCCCCCHQGRPQQFHGQRPQQFHGPRPQQGQGRPQQGARPQHK